MPAACSCTYTQGSGASKLGVSEALPLVLQVCDPLYLQRQSSDRHYLPRHSSFYRMAPAKWPVRDRHNTPPKRVLSSKFSYHLAKPLLPYGTKFISEELRFFARHVPSGRILWHSRTARKFCSVSFEEPDDLLCKNSAGRSQYDDQAWGSPQGPSTLLPAYLEGQLLRPGLDGYHPQSA